ncbi:MAG: hypothetical protein NTX04_02780 [Verrucomicrobia bacterium]|nr:hypothetical protein [Verrucomicrobiota bacterium]
MLTRLKALLTTENLEHYLEQKDPHPLQPPLRKKTKTGQSLADAFGRV